MTRREHFPRGVNSWHGSGIDLDLAVDRVNEPVDGDAGPSIDPGEGRGQGGSGSDRGGSGSDRGRVGYATVREERRKGRVASIRRTVALGDEAAVEEVLRASVCSRTINTSLVERRHARDRGRERTEVAADVPVQQGLAGA